MTITDKPTKDKIRKELKKFLLNQDTTFNDVCKNHDELLRSRDYPAIFDDRYNIHLDHVNKVIKLVNPAYSLRITELNNPVISCGLSGKTLKK